MNRNRCLQIWIDIWERQLLRLTVSDTMQRRYNVFDWLRDPKLDVSRNVVGEVPSS